MFRRHRLIGAALMWAALASPAYAQRIAPVPVQSEDWTHGTTLAVAGGVARGSSDGGGMFAGAIGWELRPRLALEGNALWFEPGGGTDGFAAAIKVRAGLVRTGVSPFVEGGFGLFRFSQRNVDALPPFYRRRVASGATSVEPFTDPMFQVGGGINVFLSRKFAVQPALEAMIVTRGGHAYVVTAASVRLAYHFEDHPVTLGR